MSRCCARKSPQTPRLRGSASSAARLRTERGGQSRSSACLGLSKRRTRPPRPKRDRNAQDVRALGNVADAHSREAPAPVGATPSGPSEGAPPPDASDRRVRTIRRVGVGPRGQMPRGLKAARASAASTALQREVMVIVEITRHVRGAPAIRRASANLTDLRTGRVPLPAKAAPRDRTTGAAGHASAALTAPQRKAMAIAEMARHERGTPEIRRASASLIGLRAGRVPRPARVDRRDLRTRAVASAQTSNQDRRAQERVMEIGRRALAEARAAKADRRAAAPHQRGDPGRRGKDRRRATAVRDGHRESRDRCESSAAASRAARW